MASKYAQSKYGFKLSLVEILTIVSFLFMIATLILSITTENPREFVTSSVKNAINNNRDKSEDNTPKFEFSGGGGAPAPGTSKIIFANEDSREYRIGMQELVDQGLLPSIPKSGDDSYFYFEDREKQEKVFIARLLTKDEEENCITSNENYSCIFYDFDQIVIYYEKNDKKEVVYDNRESR